MSNSLSLRLEKRPAPAGAAAKENLAKAIDSAVFLEKDLHCLSEQTGLIGLLAQHELDVLVPMVKRLHLMEQLLQTCACWTAHH